MIEAVVGIDARKLRRLRLSKGLTQVELAKKAEVSPDTIVRWEGRGGRRPHPGSLFKLAQALGVEPLELLED